MHNEPDASTSSKRPQSPTFEVKTQFQGIWESSGVKEVYLEWINSKINQIVDNLCSYDPDDIYDPYELSPEDYQDSLEMLAYTTTELMAQFCAGGFSWLSTDKARFLSPTVDLVSIIKDRVSDIQGNLNPYFKAVESGVWGFLEMSEYTGNWIETQKLDKQEVAYLLWSAKQTLYLIDADERIPGFTNLALSDLSILNGYTRCDSPIESILYMQLVMENLRPPKLRTQFVIDKYRVDFAVPEDHVVIECDGEKYHNSYWDTQRDKELETSGWMVLRFSAKDILEDPSYCSSRIYYEYPWTEIDSGSELK